MKKSHSAHSLANANFASFDLWESYTAFPQKDENAHGPVNIYNKVVEQLQKAHLNLVVPLHTHKNKFAADKIAAEAQRCFQNSQPPAANRGQNTRSFDKRQKTSISSAH